jgi:Protein of unknown function (DUF2934)
VNRESANIFGRRKPERVAAARNNRSIFMSEREHRIREIAHRLWEEEGRPSHQDKRHWATAERMFDAQEEASRTGSDTKHRNEEAETAGPTGTGKRRTVRKAAKRTPVESQTSVTRPH